ncbi:Protein FAR1-RELATED SEQUENCE 5 [Hordeum vulgare]|nr:Protein FAR1-RELATED SEQUENCE 5 [Hordeum vulgare]
MVGMINASDVQHDKDDGDDDAISSRPFVPYMGMTFDIVDNARAYYNKYASMHGFGIRKSASKNSQARGLLKLTGRTFTCVHAGKGDDLRNLIALQIVLQQSQAMLEDAVAFG